jgi:hypothetical protein
MGGRRRASPNAALTGILIRPIWDAAKEILLFVREHGSGRQRAAAFDTRFGGERSFRALGIV